jgi:CubicO group peptidase (beta-lactamase class C family)
MMKQLAITILCVSILTACGNSDNDTDLKPPIQPDSYSAVRSAAQQELTTNKLSPAVSIAIYKKGKVVFAEAFGNKQLDGNEAVDKDTLFQLGSVTKMFTALAILQLVEQGMFQLDDTLVNVLPEFYVPAWQTQSWQSITVRDLLTHQSGLYDAFAEETLSQPLVKAMQTSHPNNTVLMGPPGKFYNYSNPNFSYLGAIVEQYTQTDYRQWMKDQVFMPLGMANTTMRREDAEEYGNVALGVLRNEGQVIAAQSLADINDYPVMIPAGSYTWSTPSELVEMAGFLISGNKDVLSETLHPLMTEKHVNVDDTTFYGFGVEVYNTFEFDDSQYNQAVWHHGGFTGAYTASFVLLPEQDIAIAILGSGPESFENTMTAAINAAVELSDPKPIDTTPIDTSVFAHYEGVYIDYANDLTFIVSAENDELNLRVPELDSLGQSYSPELMAEGDGVFYASAAGQDFYFRFIYEDNPELSIYMVSREAVGIREGFEPW